MWPQVPQSSGPMDHFVYFGLHLKLHSIDAVINLSVDDNWKLQINYCNIHLTVQLTVTPKNVKPLLGDTKSHFKLQPNMICSFGAILA